LVFTGRIFIDWSLYSNLPHRHRESDKNGAPQQGGSILALGCPAMFLADLNLHSTFSRGELSIPELVDLYGSRGFGAIAVTDRVFGSESWLGRTSLYLNRSLTPAIFPLYLDILRTEAERAWKKYQMVLIPGLEISRSVLSTPATPKTLALGVSRFINADLEIPQLTRAIREQGGLAIAGRSLQLFFERKKLRSYFDAWELSAGNPLSSELLETSLPVVAGSGFYRTKNLASWKSCFFGERSQENVFEGIRKQELCFKYFSDERQGDLNGRNRDSLSDSVTGDDRSTPLRHFVVTDALSRYMGGARPLETIRAGLRFEALERRGQWNRGEPPKFL
jgi:hypothetical protein